MSMPSSSEEVATTQRSRPDFRSSSIRARWSLETEPWWARASTGSAPAVLPACAIMCAGVRGRGGQRTARPRGTAARLVPAAAGGHQLALGVDLVEPGGEPLREPAGVGEHDGGLVGQHQVHDLLLDVRPDRGVRLQPGRRARVEGPGGALEIGHVLDRDGDGQVPGLLRRRRHDLDRRGARQELRHEFLRLHGRGEPDPLGRLGQQRVEAFQRDGQVRAALGAGDGVHLVHDDRVHLVEGLARLGGEHQEERLGGGDQDVRRVAQQRAAVRRRRVPGADAHRDQRRGQAEALGGLGDADQRGAQVAFDVDAERLERGNVQHPGFPLRRLPPDRLRGRGIEPGQLFGFGGCGDQQPVQRPEERREGLAGAGRRHHQGVRARGNRIPGAVLRRRGRGEGAQEPLPGRPAEPVHGVGRECAAGELLPLHSSIMP